MYSTFFEAFLVIFYSFSNTSQFWTQCKQESEKHWRWQYQLKSVYHSRYISFSARSEARKNTKKKRLISFTFRRLDFFNGFFMKKKMLLRTSWSLVVNPYLSFGQKNLVLNLNVWQVESFVRWFHLCEQHVYQIFLSNVLIRYRLRWCLWRFKCLYW